MTPSNGRVAAAHLKGQVEAAAFVEGEVMHCVDAVADILGAPDRSRTSQLIYGDRFLVLEVRNGVGFGQSLHDGYCGYVHSDQLGQLPPATHWVASAQSHLYPDSDMKLLAKQAVYLGSEVNVEATEGAWARLGTGDYLPSRHIAKLDCRLDDPAGAAELLVGTPYFWGGNTRYGIDCSGLVQIAFRACGLECPRDSDMQERDVGVPVPDGAPTQRGDLVFWKGHVGIMTAPDMMLHANAHHMSTVYEPLDAAIERIAAAGNGPVTSIKRP